LIGLSGQRGNILGLRDAVLAVTAGADFGLGFSCIRIGSTSRRAEARTQDR